MQLPPFVDMTRRRGIRRRGLGMLLFAILLPSGLAQVSWTQITAANPPKERSNFAMVYDSARGRVVLFGGVTPGMNGETWEFSGTSWTLRSSTSAPSIRWGHSLAYDSARRRTVLFGGNRNLNLSDTWEWDGADWIKRAPALRPPARFYHAMAYDSARQRTVLFAGLQGSTRLSDTWEWDGRTWIKRTPAMSPPARWGHALVYDSARRRVVLFGGYGFNDTWEWDGTSWTRRTPATSPSWRYGTALAYDSARARTVLFGGATNNTFPEYADTWEWDGTSWIHRKPAKRPAARGGHALVYDSARGKLLLFGGYVGGVGHSSETWEYASTNPATYSTFGKGCAGSVGTPVLVAVPGQRPWLSENFTLQVSNLTKTRIALVFLGLSKTAWGQSNLPLDLTYLGMPGCSLFTSGELVFPVVNSGGTARLILAVPNSTQLVGCLFYNQALVLDPPANAFGAILSNAGEGKLGAK